MEGVDNSPEMLSLCREKARCEGLHPTLYQQPMERLDLPRVYRTIVVYSSSFQLLTDLDSGRRAMDRFYRHLDTGGALVMAFMTLWSEGDPLETDWELSGEAKREDGAVVRRYTWFRYDVETQLEYVEFRYEVTLDARRSKRRTSVSHPKPAPSLKSRRLIYIRQQDLDRCGCRRDSKGIAPVRMTSCSL